MGLAAPAAHFVPRADAFDHASIQPSLSWSGKISLCFQPQSSSTKWAAEAAAPLNPPISSPAQAFGINRANLAPISHSQAASARVRLLPVTESQQPLSAHPASLRARLAAFAADIKIAHTVFALPWALLATFLAANANGNRFPRLPILALILLCMITARTVAMAMNRLLDASLDAMNPRTRGRAIPSGQLSRPFVIALTALTAAAFVAITVGFCWLDGNRLPLLLSIPVLAFLSAYPLLKRFTRLCHYYLGVALALAPLCAWIAVTGTVDLPPLLMAGAVVLWTAGFDILYACQDFDNDRRTGIFSIPAKVGIPAALFLARLTHAASWVFMLLLWRTTPQFGVLFLVAVSLAGLLLIIENALVRPTDLSRLGFAFFVINGGISILIGIMGIADILLHRAL